MRGLLPGSLCLFLALGTGACKDPETQAVESRLNAGRKQLADGRRLLATGQAERAVVAFKAALSNLPNDPTAYLLLSQAEREAGNETAAILSMKQAAALTRNAEPSMKKQLAGLYAQDGHEAQAVAVLQEMVGAGQLSEAEILSLARMQAHTGDVEGAFKTLERIQRDNPDDPEAKVAEAEILLLNGDEGTAVKIMERLMTQQPNLVSARVLHARYLLNNGSAEQAEKDLAPIAGEDARRPEVVELKARMLNQLKRYDEAEAALQPLLQGNPRDVDLIAQLAEVKLNLGQTGDAEALVDRALGLRPRYARALYVRGRAQEVEGALEQAAENYRLALESSPGFAPALSRMWRLYQRQGKRADAISALERLFFLNEASLEEKAALAELYAEAHMHQARARKLIDEAVRRDPGNSRYKEISRAVGHTSASRQGGSEVEVIHVGR